MLQVLVDSRHGLGDLVQSIPLIKKLSENEKINIGVIVQSNIHKEILKRSEVEGLNFFVFNSKGSIFNKLKSTMKIRKFKTDIFLISPVSNIRKSITFGKVISTKKIYISSNNIYKGSKSIGYSNPHMINRNLTFLEVFGLEKEYETPYLFPSIDSSTILNRFDLIDYVVLAIGANKLSYNINGEAVILDIKQYPLDKYMEVVNNFADTKFVILGGDKEQNETREYFSKNPIPENLTNLSGTTSINESIDILYGSKAVIGGDTGLIHIAEALGKHTISLFGPTNDLKHAPISNKAHVISTFEENDKDLLNSMNRIQVKDVINKLKEILQNE